MFPNLTATVSDHLRHCVKHFSNPLSGSKSNIYEKVCNFEQVNFILDYLAKARNSVIKKENQV